MRTVVSILYYLLLTVWSLFYFVLMLVLWAVTVLFDRNRIVLHRASNIWAKSIIWMNPLWKLKVTGKENVDPNGTYVITVNHQSMADIPLMYVLPKINFKWVAKTFVKKIPLFGVILRLHGDIIIEPGSVKKTKEFMEKGKDYLDRGVSLIIFPEGTRSKDGEIHAFREGAFTMAQRAGVAVLPCVVNGMKTFIKGWRVQRNVFEVSIMKPVSAGEVAATPVRELMNNVRETTVSELAALRGKSPEV